MGFLGNLMRRKAVSEETLEQTSLARVLGLVDLSCLAIGSTLGLGIYVLAGDVAKHEAGPAVIISFLVAAVASLFAALCYAEFAARVPRAGSAYVYSYVCVGEFIAFVIGWNLILEYVIGTASVARGYSAYVDSIFDKKMENAFIDCCGMDVDFLSKYFDFFAFALVFFLAVLLAVGVKESTRFNNVFTVCNLVVVLYVIICGLFKLDIKNWRVDPAQVNAAHPDNSYELGTGGFFPFGFSGMMAGAARCFYGFVGFDAVATTGEEAKNPQRNIPISIIVGLMVIFLAYFGVSAVLTLMYPYYLQQDEAPIPYVFEQLGWESARWIVTIGALFGLSSSLLGALFPLPRILYAMAKDGLIFRSMANIHPRFQTPFWSTLFSGLFAAFMASLFDLEQLVDMMSIGTLLAYSLVAICVLVLRYRDENIGMVMHDNDGAVDKDGSTDRLIPEKNAGWLAQLINKSGLKEPTHTSAALVNYITVAYALLTVAFCGVIVYAADAIMDVEAWALALTAVLGVAMLLCVLAICLQPQSKAHLFFKVPLVPILPMLSVFVNFYLMMKLSSATWIRFGCWMAIGLVIYFGYGMWHSSARIGQSSDDEDVDVRQRPDDLVLDKIKNNLELPTITIEPATPRPGSLEATPIRGKRLQLELETPPSEISVETCPEPEPEPRRQQEPLHGQVNHAFSDDSGAQQDVSITEQTKDLHVRKVDKTSQQEADMLFLSKMVKQQRGLHSIIATTLKHSWVESGRGKQLAALQQAVDCGSLRVSYIAPLPAMEESSSDLKQLAYEDRLRHEQICQYLGVTSRYVFSPIQVSAEIHSEEPSSVSSDEPDTQYHVEELDKLDAECSLSVEVPLAITETADDSLLTTLACADPQQVEELSEHLAEESASQNPVEEAISQKSLDSITAQSVQSAVTEMASGESPPKLPFRLPSATALLVAHASVCECFQRGWIDLGKGALMADEQRTKYVDADARPPAPTSNQHPPQMPTLPMSPAHLEEMSHMVSQQHEQIVKCLSASVAAATATPPNTPIGEQKSPTLHTPLGASLSNPASSSASSGGTRLRRPLSRTVSGEAGFSNIPPQSPDSPYAQRVGTKFLIIPVDDGTDSEREEDVVDQTDAEVLQAMKNVQMEVRNVLALADTNSEDGDDEAPATPTASDDVHSLDTDSDVVMTPIPTQVEQNNHEGSIGNSSTDRETEDIPKYSSTVSETSPDVKQAMSSVLSQLRDSQRRRIPPPPPTPPTPPALLEHEARSVPVSRSVRKPNLAAAPPEPSMKDKLDQIIAEAVAKAARRVTEHPSSSDESTPSSDPVTSESALEKHGASEPHSDVPRAEEQRHRPKPTEEITSGMGRVRSQKQRPTPSIDMRELMARFEKKS